MLKSIRQEIDLTGIWDYKQDHNSEGKAENYDISGLSEDGWQQIKVPSVFVHCNTEIGDNTGSIWYKRTFKVPEEAYEKKASVVFDAVNFHAKVWINGHYAGGNDIGFLPFEIEADSYLKRDSENEIIVWVNNEVDPSELPPFFGWRNQGGIIRDVRLNFYNPIRVTKAHIVAEPAEFSESDIVDGNINLKLAVDNYCESDETVNIKVCIYDNAFNKKACFNKENITIKSGETRELTLDETIADIMTWTPEHPNLYHVEVSVIQGDTIIDNKISRFGFRKIEIKNRKILLNGKPVFLLGFNRHDDTYETGMALDKEAVRKDVEDIKSMGSNFMRMCHYPHSSFELDLCDELGLIVLAEIPLTFSNGVENLPGQLKNARIYLKRMIDRDMNHPSIFFWSVSNETGEGFEETNEVNDNLVQYAKELDPTRFAVHVSQCAFWGGEKASRIFRYDDVICINGYPSLDARYRTKGDYDLNDSCEYWVSNFKNLRNLYPDKPILITEFGYATGSDVDGDQDEDMQAAAIEKEFSVLTDEWVVGCSIWCYADHLWPMMLAKNISPYGLLRLDRSEKKAYKVVRKLYKERSENMKS